MTMNIKIIFCDPLPRLVLHLQGEIVQELIKMQKVQGGGGIWVFIECQTSKIVYFILWMTFLEEEQIVLLNSPHPSYSPALPFNKA